MQFLPFKNESSQLLQLNHYNLILKIFAVCILF